MAPIMGMVAQANDADLVTLLDRQIGLPRGIEGQPMLCARVEVQGPGALGADHRYLAEGVLEEAYRQRLAIADANRDVAPRRGSDPGGSGDGDGALLTLQQPARHR
ncbi:hypothetical protein, partial [Pararhodobacter sp.]|uniref:hypothetical protein n=1 Tax=Pararhodobacter sp. TaxID=2127056 RepID=UPI002AFDE7E5